MQFRRVEAGLERRSRALPHVDLAELRGRVKREYELFTATLAEWSRLTDAWYAKTRATVVARWEKASYRAESRALIFQLRMQHRRLELLGAQLA
jgi:hypothetical protein